MKGLLPLLLFTALWGGPSRAVISWSQPDNVAQTCLYRQPAQQTPILIRCFVAAPPGGHAVTLGDVGPLDASYRATAGDTFVLIQDGARQTAPLRSVVYFPFF